MLNSTQKSSFGQNFRFGGMQKGYNFDLGERRGNIFDLGVRKYQQVENPLILFQSFMIKFVSFSLNKNFVILIPFWLYVQQLIDVGSSLRIFPSNLTLKPSNDFNRTRLIFRVLWIPLNRITLGQTITDPINQTSKT